MILHMEQKEAVFAAIKGERTIEEKINEKGEIVAKKLQCPINY